MAEGNGGKEEREGVEGERISATPCSRRCGEVMLVHGQVTIIFVVSVCLFVCAEFFSAVFDPIWIKLGHMLYVRV